MQFYDATNKQGICQEADRLCDTDDTSYPRVQKTSRANQTLELIVGKLINSDGDWQFDDTNYTDTPIGTINLTEAQAPYSFNDKLLDLEQVSIKDVNGRLSVLKPIDPKHFKNIAIEEYFEDTGLPTHYDKIGNTITLYPAPTATDVTLSAGLKVRFKRTASLFTVVATTVADTTVPGFASPWHYLVAYGIAIPYCMTYKKDRVGLYEKRFDEGIKELKKHYALREKDNKSVITTAPIRGGKGWR